jgi:Tfp pilus assembly protein PilO
MRTKVRFANTNCDASYSGSVATMNHILDAQTRRFGRVLHYSGVLATVIGMTASYSLLHAPLIRETARTEEKIQELALSVQNTQAIRKQHQIVSERLATAKESIATVRERVPQNMEAADFLDEVSRIAAEEEMSIKEYSNGKAVASTGYMQLEVNLSGRGSYASICSFIDRISKLKRLSKVQNLTLTASGSAAEYPLTATLIIYYGLHGADDTSAQEVKRG